MHIGIKRVYEEPARGDGLRVLVDRVWPRGLNKERAAVDEWYKELAPSTELRKWFAHDPQKWSEFKRRYFREIERHPETVDELLRLARRRRLTLVFAARDSEHNNAVALRGYLEQRLGT